MKLSLHGFSACVAALITFALVGGVQAQQQGKAVVRAIKGTAKYKAGAGDWAPLKVNAVLQPGSVVETAADSQVDLFLGDNGPVVRVTPASQLSLDKLTINKTGVETVVETELGLKSGTILGHVKKLAQNSKYEVRTPNSVCGIRGTQYKISASGVVFVVEGLLKITYVDPANPGNVINVDVPAGSAFFPPSQGQASQVRPIAADDPVNIEIRDADVIEGSRLVIPPSDPPKNQDDTQNFDTKQKKD